MKDFVIDLPSSDTPGYLRRQKTAIALMRRFKNLESDPDEQIIDDMVEFLLPFVSEPKDRYDAMEMILDFSEDDFNKILDAVVGAANEQTAIEEDIPPAKGRN